jgi:Domain of unknown function (DUF1707)
MAAHTRIGDADRDRLAAELREHFAAGRLNTDELDRRLGVVLAADYADEADAVFADLPSVSASVLPATARARQVRGRHSQSTAPGDGWTPTSERFRDPSSGTIMRVWVDPSDDSRHYVPEE